MSHLVPLCKGGRYYVILFERDFSNETTILDFHNRNFDSVDLDLKKFNKVKDLYEEIEYELKSDENDNFKYSRNLLNQILILLKREKLKKETTTKSRSDLICRATCKFKSNQVTSFLL